MAYTKGIYIVLKILFKIVQHTPNWIAWASSSKITKKIIKDIEQP